MALSLELFVRKRLTYQDLNRKVQQPIQNYINQYLVHQSEVSTGAVGDKIIKRDALGRAKVSAPSANDDIARKDTVDTVQTNLDSHTGTISAHQATPLAMTSRIMMRDSRGRAKVAAPSEADDIARKDTVDAHEAKTSTHGATSAATASRIMMRDSAGRAKVAAPSTADDIARKDTVDGLKTQIEDGTVVAGNASKLDGIGAGRYAKIEEFGPGTILVEANTTEEILLTSLVSPTALLSYTVVPYPSGAGATAKVILGEMGTEPYIYATLITESYFSKPSIVAAKYTLKIKNNMADAVTLVYSAGQVGSIWGGD